MRRQRYNYLPLSAIFANIQFTLRMFPFHFGCLCQSSIIRGSPCSSYVLSASSISAGASADTLRTSVKFLWSLHSLDTVQPLHVMRGVVCACSWSLDKTAGSEGALELEPLTCATMEGREGPAVEGVVGDVGLADCAAREGVGMGVWRRGRGILVLLKDTGWSTMSLALAASMVDLCGDSVSDPAPIASGTALRENARWEGNKASQIVVGGSTSRPKVSRIVLVFWRPYMMRRLRSPVQLPP